MNMQARPPTRSDAPDTTSRPWEKHLRLALVLCALAFAAGELWNLMAGAALGAAAFFVALRPLFLEQAQRYSAVRSGSSRSYSFLTTA
ncbi:MAG: hypothetical protein K0R58_3083 [Ramlibacter sp.]|jgi:hypothetical protein|nr:hypothetical protein [Ramlibacter sp.]